MTDALPRAAQVETGLQFLVRDGHNGEVSHLSTAQLEAGQVRVLEAPTDVGTVEMIVRRPDIDVREVLPEAELKVGRGLVGDNYIERGNNRTDDGLAHPEAQINLMSAAAVDLVADGDRARWPLAGDQFFVDFDLSIGNAPAGTRLRIGTAVIEVSAMPHNGCAKFAKRFGLDAAKWANSSPENRFRGINAMVIEDGVVRQGDKLSKVRE